MTDLVFVSVLNLKLFCVPKMHDSHESHRDNELSIEELHAFFKGDERIANIYLSDMDDFSHEVTARDG